MTLALEIPLDPELSTAFQALAAQHGQRPEQVVGELVRGYVRQQRRAQLAHETEAYLAQHATLTATYLGQHIAFYNGQVVDHDADPTALAQRVRQTFGHAPVLVTLVRPEPEPELRLRSPRLVERP